MSIVITCKSILGVTLLKLSKTISFRKSNHGHTGQLEELIIDHNDNRNLVHPHGPLLEEVTVSTRNNFVSNVITYKSIIRIILINLGKTIPFTKSNYENKEQL